MHIHQPHVVQVVSISANGRAANAPMHAVNTQSSLPEYVQEDMDMNATVESWQFSYDLGDTTLMGEIQPPDSDGILLTSKKKNTEMSISTKCSEWRVVAILPFIPSVVAAAAPIRNSDRSTQEWNGSFFEQRSLKELGLVVQLGHPVGFSCDKPWKVHETFVVIDVTGVHEVNINYYLCDSRVERRQQLMRVCWWPATAREPRTCAMFSVVSAHNFLRLLELLTNNDGLHPVPDCWRAFRHIVRQFRTTLMMKRAGCSHDPSGIQGTAQGELALQCRSCPQPGRNLPDGWDRINWDAMPEDLRYKYFLFMAQDCNFRLINRNVSSVTKDPILGNGYGYFVNNAKYTEWISQHVTEEEVSSCSGFQAMFLANRKQVKGLRTTGIGDVTKSFWSQMQSLPETMHLLIEVARVWFKVLNFHLPPHVPACHSAYSFHMWGAGRTHNETIEQNWEFTNGAAASTKMMGIGTRHDMLEDLFGFYNWRRLVSGQRIFTKRMVENVKEGQVHRDAFNAFDATLRETALEMVEGWKNWVHRWESRQHTDGTELPFELKEKAMTMRDIKNKLAKEELLRSGDGVEVEREDTPSTFILMGLEIEDSQQHLAIDVKVIANPMEIQTVDILKRRAALLKRLWAFCKLQQTYMPNLRTFLTPSQHQMWDSETDRDVGAVRLFLPSDILDAKKRMRACAVGLLVVEADLHVGEAREALNALRQGQRMLTWGQGILRQINLKIHKAKLRYHYVRNALKQLKGDGPWERELRVLEDNDVRALNKRTLTDEEAEQPKEPTEVESVDALCVEWYKAYARMQRWHEDVVLVEEEMRRIIEYGHWAGREWARRVDARAGVEEELLEGEKREATTRETLAVKWAGVHEKGHAYLAWETAPGVEVVVPLDEEEDDGDEDEEGSPDYSLSAKVMAGAPYGSTLLITKVAIRGPVE
ncbi:hypothetical protein DFH08DRAFT_798213 [Mycena albidolilacea]|uniref:CxC2-like cysteine cluster KDZ transposase-associated domain-containing protein n=1 Tax=Mycena albidolilacea TaxID=1033008 RepID=A0AAD7ANY3_9AGAR|nr:hypothetical protein DFH08DRAFT_798213 [Mycena albidolilacea]